MKNELRPHNVATLLAGLCAIPIIWVFGVQGVTTTYDTDLLSGNTTSSSNFGTQFGKVAVYLVLMAVFGIAGWYMKVNDTPWPPAIQQLLAGFNLAPSSPPPSRGAHFNPPPNWPVLRGWEPPPGWEPDPSWPPAPPGWQLWTYDVPIQAARIEQPEPHASPPDAESASGTDQAAQRPDTKADPLAEYRRQATQHFSSPPQPPQADAPTTQLPFGADPPTAPIPVPAISPGHAGPSAYSAPNDQPVAALLLVAAGLLIAALMLRSLVDSFGAALPVTLLDAALLLGYLVFRQRNPAAAHNLEGKALAAGDRLIAKLMPAPNTAPGARWVAGPSRPRTSESALPSAILLASSVIPYLILTNVARFSSMWQPWLLGMSPIAVLIAVIAIRSRRGANRALALFIALAGAAVYVFATVPASWGMQHIVTFSDDSWQKIHTLMLWSERLPILALAAFVVAWGIARRRNPSWWLGLIPTGIAIAVAIWANENPHVALQSSHHWLGAWLIEVGPFAVGCLACWAADVLRAPRSPGPYVGVTPPGY